MATLHLLHVDCPLVLAGAPTMSGDPWVMVQTADREFLGLRRYYYVSAGPWRALLVMRNGDQLFSLMRPDCYVKALIGWDDGERGFVRPENEGKRHTKISVDMMWLINEREAALLCESGLVPCVTC
jgi:hypothetical protein